MSEILNQLDIPPRYKDYIFQSIEGLSQFDFVDKLYLFGSCARGSVQRHSDIDLLVVTTEKICDEIICNEVMNILPEMHGSELYSDMIFLSREEVAKNIDTLGHISRVILKGGIDLSELLYQRRIERESSQSLTTV